MKNEEILKLIPKNKFDYSTISQLMTISEEDVKPILPKLLGWIADFNWPIAEDVCKVLARFPTSMVTILKEALKPEAKDDTLKYWIILCLVPLYDYEMQLVLLEDIKRIYEHPTESEVYEEVPEEVRDFLEGFYKS